MQDFRSTNLPRVLIILAVVLILKVTASVLLGYRDYFPPNFESDFLRGRQSYFFGAYQGAFNAHLVSGPISLLLGLVLLSDRFRRRFPRWHRSLGKMQVANVLLLLTPSGLWMAYYAQTGTVAAWGFAGMAIATAVCVLLGWRTAVKRRFVEHRCWMTRCFLMLCSAVVIRLFGGLATVTGAGGTWSYPLAAWLSWLAPLAVYELSRAIVMRLDRAEIDEKRQSSSLITALSSPAMEISARR